MLRGGWDPRWPKSLAPELEHKEERQLEEHVEEVREEHEAEAAPRTSRRWWPFGRRRKR